MSKSAVDHMDVRWRVKGTTQWSAPRSYPPAAEVSVDGLERGKDYEFEVRNVSTCGATSIWVSSDYTVPDAPVGTLTLVAMQQGIQDASSSAAAANARLADIASDNVLSPAEKPTVMRDYSVITTEQAGIDAQATQYGVTTEKSDYDNAISTLTAYLNTLNSPVPWNNKSGNTDITGSTFKSYFTSVYTTRQTLLNAIYATAKGLADNAQSTANIANTTAGTALTNTQANVPLVNNPYFSTGDLTGWTSDHGSVYFESGTNGPASGSSSYAVFGPTVAAEALRNTGKIPVYPGAVIKAQCAVRGIGSPDGSCGVRISWRGADDLEIGSTPGNTSTGNATNGTYVTGSTTDPRVMFAHVECATSGHTVGYYTVDNFWGAQLPDSMDQVPDGTTYARTSTGALTGGNVDLAKAGVINKNLGNIGDGGGRFGVHAVDSNNLALVDFSQSGHVNKVLDNIGDGATYGRIKGASLTGNDFDFAKGGVNKTLGYVPDGGGRYGVHQVDGNGLAVIDFSQSAHVNKTLDYVPSGQNFTAIGINQTGNLLQNPTAANGSSGWTLNGWIASGFAGSTYFALPTVNNTSVLSSQSYPVSGMTQMTIAADFYTMQMTGGALYLQTTFYDSTGAYISQAGPAANFGAASFTRISQTIPVPSNASTWSCFGFCNGSVAGSNAALRRIRIESGSVANPFDDMGSQMGNLATVPGGGHKAYADFTDNTSGGHVGKHLDNVGDGPSGNRSAVGNADIFVSGGVNRVGLRVAGSTHRLGDQGNAPASLTSNLGMVRSATALTASSTGAVNVNAHSVTYGPRVVPYNAVPNAVTGLAQGSSYYIYAHDNGLGGSPTWLSTTSAQTVNRYDDAYNAGLVTIPTSGTSGGGGGGGNDCVCDDMWLRPGLTARDLATRWRWWRPFILRGQHGWHFVRRRPRIVQEHCCRAMVADGSYLDFSNSTPVTTQTGESILAPMLYGHCMWTDSGWQRVIEVKLLPGLRDVVRICVGGHTFLAGADPYRRLDSHNVWKP